MSFNMFSNHYFSLTSVRLFLFTYTAIHEFVVFDLVIFYMQCCTRRDNSLLKSIFYFDSVWFSGKQLIEKSRISFH